MKYPYLYCDIDGTLAEKSVISEENIAALARWRQAGGKLGLATGRVELITQSFADRLEVDLPCILYNGAAVYDFAQKRFLHKEGVPKEDMLLMVRLGLAAYPAASVELCPGGPTVLANPNGVEDVFITRERQPYLRRAPEECGDCIKVMFYGDPEQLKKAEAALLPRFGESYHILFSQPMYLEILPRGVGKESGLRWVSEYLSQPLSSFAAMGDYDNDSAMISLAGLGAAPADAPQRVKDKADFIAPAHTAHAAVGLVDYLLRQQ